MKADNMFTEEPCKEAIDWLETQPDFETAWQNCERGEWMWWALEHSKNSLPKKKTSVAFAKWCAKRAKNYAAAKTYAAAYAAAAFADAVAAAYAAAASADAAAKAYAAAAERKAQADWIRKHCTWNG